MHALVRFAQALFICAGCSAVPSDDKKAETASPSARPTNEREAALSPTEAAAGAAPDPAPPAALTNEELERLLDALEQEIGRSR